jgi:hypothetical protein
MQGRAEPRPSGGRSLGKDPHRLSFRLRKGYVAWGVKYCWGNPVWYDAGLHPTIAAAKASVDDRRLFGWGITWQIRQEPVCIASNRRRSIVFSVDSDYEPLDLTHHVTLSELTAKVRLGDKRRALIESLPV